MSGERTRDTYGGGATDIDSGALTGSMISGGVRGRGGGGEGGGREGGEEEEEDWEGGGGRRVIEIIVCY